MIDRDRDPQVQEGDAQEPQGRLTRLPEISLLLLVFLLPVTFANLTWTGLFEVPFTSDQYDIPKLWLMEVLVLVGLGGWGYSYLRGERRLRRSRGDLLVAGILGLIVLATVFSIHPATSLIGKYRRYEGLFTWFTYAGLFFLALQTLWSKEFLRKVAIALVLSGLAVSAYGLLQYWNFDPAAGSLKLPFEARQAFSTYGNPNMLGAFLIFPLSVGLGLLLSERRKSLRALYWLAVLTIGATLLVTFSRGAWLGAFFALSGLVLVFLISGGRPRLVDLNFLGLGALGFAAFALLQSSESPVTNFVARLTSLLDYKMGSGSQRLDIWEGALTGIKEKPLLGYGPDTFRLLFPQVKPAEYVALAGQSHVADNAHNYLLQLAVTLGIPAAVLVFGFFLFVLARSSRAVWGDARDGDYLIAGFGAGVIGYLAYLMTGLTVVGSAAFLWISLGALLTRSGSWSEGRALVAGRATAWAVPAVSGVLILLTVPQLVADNYYVNAVNPAVGTEERVQKLQAAVAWNPLNEVYRAEIGLAYDFANYKYLMEAGDSQSGMMAAETMFRLGEGAFREAMDFSPHEADNYRFLAALYNRNGIYLDPANFSKAVEVAEEGIALAPNNPELRLELGYALLRSDRPAEALEHLRSAVELDPNYVEAFAVLGDVQRALGELADARTSYERAISLSPGDQQLLDGLREVERRMQDKNSAETVGKS